MYDEFKNLHWDVPEHQDAAPETLLIHLSSIEHYTQPQSHKKIWKILRNTFSMHSPYSTQWYKLAREVP